MKFDALVKLGIYAHDRLASGRECTVFTASDKISGKHVVVHQYDLRQDGESEERMWGEWTRLVTAESLSTPRPIGCFCDQSLCVLSPPQDQYSWK